MNIGLIYNYERWFRDGKDWREKTQLSIPVIIISLDCSSGDGKGKEDRSWKAVQKRKWQDAMIVWIRGLNEREEWEIVGENSDTSDRINIALQTDSQMIKVTYHSTAICLKALHQRNKAERKVFSRFFLLWHIWINDEFYQKKKVL